MDISIFVEPIDDQGQNESDVAGVVVRQVYNPPTGQYGGWKTMVITRLKLLVISIEEVLNTHASIAGEGVWRGKE